MTRDPDVPGIRAATVIGSGGFSTVHRAWQDRFERWVAVKVLQLDGLDDAATRRFERECAAMGMLSDHPNVLTVYDSGLTHDGQPYLVTELCPDGSLADRLARTGPVPLLDVLVVGAKLAGALDEAHRAGIVHRDIKPANVLVTSYGEPVLADFGLSVRPDHDGSRGLDALTPVHAAPEVLERGESGPAADLYALGSTLQTLLVGKAPFAPLPGEGTVPHLHRVLDQPPPRVPDVPPGVQALFDRLLAKDPAGRPASAAGVASWLRVLVQEVGGASGVSMLSTSQPRTVVPERPAPPPPAPPVLAGVEDGATELRPAGSAAVVVAEQPRTSRRGLVYAGAGVAALGVAAAALLMAGHGPSRAEAQTSVVGAATEQTATSVTGAAQRATTAPGASRGASGSAGQGGTSGGVDLGGSMGAGGTDLGGSTGGGTSGGTGGGSTGGTDLGGSMGSGGGTSGGTSGSGGGTTGGGTSGGGAQPPATHPPTHPPTPAPTHAPTSSLPAGWHGPTGLGGALKGGADPASWAAKRLDVFVVGTNGHLFTRTYAGSWGSSYKDLGMPSDGALTSDPSAVSWASGRIDVFARGHKGELQHKYYASGKWSAWDNRGGAIVGAPDAASWASGRLDVFVTGTNGHLYQTYFSGSWSKFVDHGKPSSGGLSSGPTATSWAKGRIDVFARGADKTLVHTWFTGGKWAGWQGFGGALQGAPDVATQGSGRLDVVIRSNNALYAKTFAGGKWGAFRKIGGALASDPGIVSWASGRLDVFYRGTNGAMQQLYYVA